MKTCKTGFVMLGKRVISLFALTGIILGLGSAATAQTAQTNLAVTVRHAPNLNGNPTIEECLKEQPSSSVNAYIVMCPFPFLRPTSTKHLNLIGQI
jgi:predicted component of type VI protein secretion system